MSKFNEMHVQYYNYRVEFQMRGAGHIHGVLWIDFTSFSSDDRNKDIQQAELSWAKLSTIAIGLC